MTKSSFVLVLLAACGIACAQDEVIVLSPFEVASATTTAKSPIVVKKRADFLLLEILVANNARDAGLRRDEIYATLRSMISGVPKASKIELFTGEFTLTANHYQIPLREVFERGSTSRGTLYAKVPLGESDDVDSLADTLRSFVKTIKGEGHTEIFAGNLGLSIRNPEKYRYEVIQAIATDVKKLRDMFGDGFEIVVKGLDARLKWERSSISEVELSLPFRYEVFPIKAGKVLPVEK